jgi:YfiH family protein
LAAPSTFTPAWSAPASVGAAFSLRHVGASGGAFASMNLGGAVGDEPAAVASNRQRFGAAIGALPVWLRQVHGTAVLRLRVDAPADVQAPADAAWTTEPGLACTVLVADCLPLLLATRDGRAVAAVHAGWRGLAAGVLEATLAAMHEGARVQPDELCAWLGPCIGARQFEVGADVLLAFGASPLAPDPEFFVSRPRPDGSPRWLANLPALARLRLQRAGVPSISVDGRCTVENASDFFSFRRDGVCGRMAAAVWRRV